MKDEMQTNSPGAMVLERLQLDIPDGIHLGSPRSVGSLTMVPVFHEGPTAAYIPYASVMTGGLVEVREVTGGGQVNTLVATNRSDQPVLLLEGEILEGMQQTRVLNITIMVPALTTLNIPVSCVEAGRWNATSEVARRHDYHMSPRARARKSATVVRSARAVGAYASDQAEVWMSVSDELAAHHVSSPTREHAEIGRQRGIDIQHALASIVPEPGQCGVAAVLGGRPLCLDMFDRPNTLAAVWSGLAGSYALDALTVAEAAVPARDLERATTWLQGLQQSVPTSHPGVGLGTNVVLSSPHAGATGLVVGDALVHLGAFAVEGGGSRFSQPSRRARQVQP